MRGKAAVLRAERVPKTTAKTRDGAFSEARKH